MSEKIKWTVRALSDRWPLILRCLLYFLLAFLPEMHKGFESFGKHETQASGWFIAALIFQASFEGLVALRAYLDGSAAKINDAVAAKSKNYDTQQFVKSV